jgi:putative flippase GtrA
MRFLTFMTYLRHAQLYHPFYMTNLIFKFLTFATIGLFNAVLDTTIWKILSTIFSKNRSFLEFLAKFKLNQYSGAQVFSFMISMCSSFYLNSTFTWKVNPLNSMITTLLYFLVTICSWFATVVFINYFTANKYVTRFEKVVSRLENKYRLPSLVKKVLDYPLVVKLASIGVSMIINFVGYNYIVFM